METPLGKPFAAEMEALPHTYEWALSLPIRSLAEAIGRMRMPLLAVGSGGSFTTAHLACALHQNAFRAIASPTTPLELATTDLELREAAVLLLTAGGNNPDILAAADEAVLREPRRLAVLCAATGSKLAEKVGRRSSVETFDFAPPAGRDGFLATNSLVASCVLLIRAYAEAAESTHGLPDAITPLIGDPAVDFSELLLRKTLLVLHPPALKAAAIDIESKFTEAALGHVQLADYRQFAHGRHHWLAKRGEDSAVLALGTAGDSPVMESTLELLPPGIPVARLLPPYSGQVACLGAIIRSFLLVSQAGRAQGIDPGDPGVPSFGRKLYHLRVFPRRSPRSGSIAGPEVAIGRKARTLPGAMVPHTGWRPAYEAFLDRLRAARIHGIVADYDGTLCDEARRFDPVPSSVATELARLLRAGIVVGIATGRGKSVRQRLQEAIPSDLWDRVVIGYYNGGEIGDLRDDALPDGKQEVGDPLRGVADLLRKHRECLGVARLELRQRQITLTPIANLDRCWQGVQGLIDPDLYPGISVLRSGHSIDILAPGVSKLSVLRQVASITGGAEAEILCIGDQGCWPGNDHRLLSTELSLSANTVSTDPGRCWNLAPAGMRESQATRHYLSRLKPVGDRVRFLIARGGKP